MTQETERRYEDLIRDQKLVETLELRQGMPMEKQEKTLVPLRDAFGAISRHISDLPISSPETREKLKQILMENSKPVPEEKTKFLEMAREHYQRQADLYNQSSGHLNSLDGINCPICKNRGYTEKVTEGFGGCYTTVLVACECMKRRRTWKQLQNSGLAGSINRLTFDNFQTNEDWQERIKTKALQFVQGHGGQWFYIGGAVGCGKTHVCTAICGELLKQCKSVKYMCWSEESVRLKGRVNDDDFDDLLKPFKDCDVLYIDDFFKTRRNRYGEAQQPTDADVKLAYQIINFRYISRKTTIISSEWLMDELMDFDEATSSRVYEMCRGSMLQIDRVGERNYRKKMTENIRGDVENEM